MDTKLLTILVCPLCKGPLEYIADVQELTCYADQLAFPVRDGIPIMLEQQARTLPAQAPHFPAATGTP